MKKKYNVEGMSCAACANAVHNILMKDPNINSAEVNLLMKQVLIVSKKECDLTALNSKLSAGGFKLSIEPVVVKPISTKLIIVLLLLALLLLYIGMSHMISFIVLPLPKVIHYNSSPIGFAIIQFILATIIMIMGFKIYRTGLKSLFGGIPNMDSLVAIGTLSAYSYSIYSTIEIMMGNSSYVHSLYYESAGVVVALVMLGNMLEERSKSKTFDAISALMNLQAKTCTILLNNEQLIVDIESLEKEQLLLIKPGEIIPSDSIIVEGNSAVNEAMLSGEGLPINKYVGDKLIGGTINLTNVLIARVSEIGENTTIKRMIKLVEDAQSIKAPIARIADKISAIFVPCVMLIAIFLTIGWIVSGATISFALSIFVSVMVIACPCALGLATPTAIMVATGVASKQGIYIKSGEALENINHVDTIVFDKTGTITSGKPVVTKVISYIDEEELIRITSSLEKNSNHPYAKAIIDYATSKNLLSPNTIISNDISGKGLNGIYNNSNIVVGSYSY
ncbi:MAG: heavy metal translocating P-type ATPase, partial [Erysipelotrichaceae bacterium]